MTHKSGGAPRSESARVAILEATARQFTSRGFAHLTVEGIAADAGVSKQTIYRWWSDKSALVADSLLEGFLLGIETRVPSTGDVRRDLHDALARVFARIDDVHGGEVFRSLIAASVENPSIVDHLRVQFGAGGLLHRRLDQAVAEGELRAGAPTKVMAELIAGSLVLRVLARTPTSPTDVDLLLDTILG